MSVHPKLSMLKAFTEFMRRKPKSLEAAYARAFEAGWQASREALEQPVISPEVQAMLKQFEVDEAAEIQRAEAFVRATERASISALQRNFKLNYASACRLMDKLVARGIVSPIDSEGRRIVLPVASVLGETVSVPKELCHE